jgi:hypothetical protein
MESVMKLIKFILMMNFFVLLQVQAAEIVYLNTFLGHVHQSPSRLSPSLTTIQCGHPIKVIKEANVMVSEDWERVQVADWKGFIWKKHISSSKPDCYQARYPKFVDAFNLDLTELYYWGRLNDHWEEGRAEP